MKTTTDITLLTADRICAHCAGPIPREKNRGTKYCHSNCSRKASYHRKTPEERAVINKRSNDRRFKKDLLPIIRGISKFPDEITPGSPVARYVISMILIKCMTCWKFQHALHFAQVQDKLAEKAGGYEELERLEDEAFNLAVKAYGLRKAQ